MKLEYVWLLLSYATSCLGVKLLEANPDAERLYDDLFSNRNRLKRPVANVSDKPTVDLTLKLSQEMEVNLKNQVITTNLCVEQKWFDYKLQWNPDDYGGVEMLYVPSEHIWLPDIVLYNNSDGNNEVILVTKATIKFTGEVNWISPPIYISSCGISGYFIPFDEKMRYTKLGSSSYNGIQVHLKHTDELPENSLVHFDIDVSEFYLSVKWDVVKVPPTRNETFYICCVSPFSDITFKITKQKKMYFDTASLILDCVGFIVLFVLLYYFPSDLGEKRTGQVNIFRTI